MSDNLEDFDFSCDSIDVIHIYDLVFLENFDGNFLASERVCANLHFPKSAFAKVTAYEN